ncbi:MAG TPA: hypothetical protein VGM62_15950 [Chthoniobacterales bacterium]
MNSVASPANHQATSRRIAANFWQNFLKEEQLLNCNNLEKLIAGCEVIVALDQVEELLAA